MDNIQYKDIKTETVKSQVESLKSVERYVEALQFLLHIKGKLDYVESLKGKPSLSRILETHAGLKPEFRELLRWVNAEIEFIKIVMNSNQTLTSKSDVNDAGEKINETVEHSIDSVFSVNEDLTTSQENNSDNKEQSEVALRNLAPDNLYLKYQVEKIFLKDIDIRKFVKLLEENNLIGKLNEKDVNKIFSSAPDEYVQVKDTALIKWKLARSLRLLAYLLLRMQKEGFFKPSMEIHKYLIFFNQQKTSSQKKIKYDKLLHSFQETVNQVVKFISQVNAGDLDEPPVKGIHLVEQIIKDIKQTTTPTST